VDYESLFNVFVSISWIANPLHLYWIKKTCTVINFWVRFAGEWETKSDEQQENN